jgi:hypothetical protein
MHPDNWYACWFPERPMDDGVQFNTECDACYFAMIAAVRVAPNHIFRGRLKNGKKVEKPFMDLVVMTTKQRARKGLVVV